jgi:hypothetical protein
VERLLRARVLQLSVFLPTVPLLVLVMGGTGAALAVAAAMIVGTTAIIVVARPYARLHVRATLAAPLIAGLLATVAAEFVLRFEHGEFIRLLSTVGVVLAVYLVSLAALDRHRLISNIRPMINSLRPDPSARPEEVA